MPQAFVVTIFKKLKLFNIEKRQITVCCIVNNDKLHIIYCIGLSLLHSVCV